MLFSTNIRFAYRGTHSDLRSVNNLGHYKPYECYYCNHFFANKGKFDKHFRSCSSKPGVVYDFNIQNFVTFEDNLSYKDDIPYCVYADFETSAPTDDCLDPENRVMFAVFYALVFAWNPKLKLDTQIVDRGFNHSLEELGDMSYLSLEQLALINQKTAEQLNDAVANVYRKKKKNAIVEMFHVELKFACDILNKWFQYKIKPNKMSICNIERINFNINNPVTTENKCCICKLRLDVMPRSSNLKEKNEMSYIDFLVAKEHAFIRNIYDEIDLKNCKNICSFQNYYETLFFYTHLVQVAENEIKTAISYEDIFDDKLRDFLTEKCPAYSDCNELVDEIKAFDVKNIGKTKVQKFTLQIYAFIYNILMDFPPCKFDEIETVTTRRFLSKFYKVLTSKINIHHSHVTGEIYGHAHDFCNWQVRENYTTVSLIGHNFLGFDILFMVKGFRASCWGTQS